MTVSIKNWSNEAVEKVGDKKLRLLNLTEGGEEIAKTNIANVLPNYYSSFEQVDRILKKRGKRGLKKLLDIKLPPTTRQKSADLGELIATEFVEECTKFRTPVKRLRHKSHKNKSESGEDVIGFHVFDDNTLGILKVEVKSRAILTPSVVNEAREQLDENDGIPSEFSLLLISELLTKSGDEDLAEIIEDATLDSNISIDQVTHMIFTFSGNAPDDKLRNELKGSGSEVKQESVGLRIKSHQDFIKSVFERSELL